MPGELRSGRWHFGRRSNPSRQMALRSRYKDYERSVLVDVVQVAKEQKAFTQVRSVVRLYDTDATRPKHLYVLDRSSPCRQRV
jgi:hypothetical protein